MPHTRTHADRKTCLFIAGLLAVLLLPPSMAHALTATGTEITNSASAAYTDANSNSFTATSNSTTVTVTSVFTVSVTSPGDASGGSNTVVYYPYTVTNTGNAPNTFGLAAATDGAGNSWTVALLFDANGDGTHDTGETTVTSTTGEIAAAATYKFFVAVTIPANTVNAQTDGTTLTVTGSGDAGTGDDTSDDVVTTAQAPTVSIVKAVRNVTTSGAFGATANAKPAETLEYRLTVANGGAIAATAVALTDSDNAYTTYVANSIYIGSNATTSDGAGNVQQDDDTAGGVACAADACGHGSASSGTVTAYLGTGATETAGGSLNAASTVYVYFRVTVD